MTTQRSVARVAKRVQTQDAKARLKSAKDAAKPVKNAQTGDSFQNFSMKYGIGTDNPTTTSNYGFNPITRNRTLLEWMHRGSWLAGMAIDIRADDMTRAGMDMHGEVDPKDVESINTAITQLGIWNAIRDTIKWARLYGGAIAVLLVDGQAMHTPLRPDRIGKDQFRGLLVLDRWMVEPSMERLVTEYGPSMGLPEFYNVTADAPALTRMKIHYTRCMRLDGVRLPYYQRLTENLWGISVLERLYDRLVAFDSATTGAAQMVYKAYLRNISIKGLRDAVATGGRAYGGVLKYMEVIARWQGTEGLTVLDSDDKFAEGGASRSFAGLSDALTHFGQQLAGAMQTPMSRLFGTSPGGLNAKGDNEMKMYYDGIAQDQDSQLLVPCTTIWRMIGQSIGIKLPPTFGLKPRPLWQLTDEEKAGIASKTGKTVGDAESTGIISKQTALMELRQQSRSTGVFTTITDEDIEAAEDVPVDPLADEGVLPGDEQDLSGADGRQTTDSARFAATVRAVAGKPAAGGRKASRPRRTGDASGLVPAHKAISAMKQIHGLDVAIENPKGSKRMGGTGARSWEAVLPAHYGYVRGTNGADSDAIDCFIGDDHDSEQVYVIDQRNLRDGSFDEHKVMLGYPDRKTALMSYEDAYTDGRGTDRIGSVSEFNMPQFQAWLESANLKQPCSGHYAVLMPSTGAQQ